MSKRYLDIDSSSDDAGSDDDASSASLSAADDAGDRNAPALALDPAHEQQLKERLAGLPAAPAVSHDKAGVVYLGRVPHGFHEEEMRAYFSQFGDVRRLRLSRNRRTGRSKHYAFVQFASADVAAIVADTMNNYLLYNHLLKCRVVPPEKVHDDLWRGADRKFRVVPYRRIARTRQNRDRSEEEVQKQQQRLVKNEAKQRKRLHQLGIEYDFPGYEAELKAKTSEQPT